MVATVSGGRMVDTGGMFSSVDDELPPLVALSSYLGEAGDVREDDVARLGVAVSGAGARAAGWSREWKNRSTSLDLSNGPL